MSYKWDGRDYFALLKEWRRRRDFTNRLWLDTKTIKADPVKNNAGVIGNVSKSYKDKDPGIYTLQGVYNSKSAPAAGGGALSSFLFLPIVAKGSPTGPSSAQITSAYPAAPFAISQGRFQGYQRWTVPTTGTYEFDIGGAGGGYGDTGYAGQLSYTALGGTYGARIVFTASLTAGDVIDIVVGVQGGSSGGAHGNENGGGGATWVVNVTTNTLLGCAGGGGGLPGANYGTSCLRNATTLAFGHGSDLTVPGYGGCSGSPTVPSAGQGGTGTGTYYGGAGGGWLSDGANGRTHCSLAYGGKGYFNGLVGGAGNTCYNPDNKGGFGGGGGGQLGGPGCGGGFTGGRSRSSWSSQSTYGGGGGSYVNPACTVVSKTLGGNTGTIGGQLYAGYCQMN